MHQWKIQFIQNIPYLKNNNKQQVKQKMMMNTYSGWSNRQLRTLDKFKTHLFQEENRITANRLIRNQANDVAFYKITPKEDLPKNLQKMNFQTLNTKEMNATSIIKVYRKESLNQNQFQIRKMLRQNGQIMMLSQIYDHFDDPLENKKVNEKKMMAEMAPLSNVINQLDEWQKCTSKKNTMQARFSKVKFPSLNNTQERRNSATHKKQFAVKKFKIGTDHRSQIEKSLQVISASHVGQPNIITKYTLIQGSSKLLKKQLEQMKELVQKQIQQKMKKLTQTRKEHHRLYEQKLRLHLQQQQLDEQRKIKDEETALQTITLGYHMLNQNTIKTVYDEKRNQIQKNQVKISKIKKNIQFLEQQKLKNQEQLKNIIKAQMAYYKISLKNGEDCRETGLVWIIKKLGLHQQNIAQTQFPTYLDKKSKLYLVAKAKNEDSLELLLQQKKEFVNQIGKQNSSQFPQRRNSIRRLSRKSSIKLQKGVKNEQQPIMDGIKESSQLQKCDSNDIPKRYSRSMKKITALREQYLKNQNLLRLTQSRRGLKLGSDLIGLTGRQIYSNIAQKIKKVDFTKLKKEKNQQKNDKIYEYQAILRKIEDLHMVMEEQDLQHEGHLLSQFKDNKQVFFTIAAACFGVKRAYSLIIKNFSWKNTL